MLLDHLLHRGVGLADEPLDDLSLREVPPQLGQKLHLEAHGQPLGVHEHAVAVEDHQFRSPAHPADPRQLPA
jgi:hypothetical protein